MSPKVETCPLCRKPSKAPSAPFCSQGCKDRDLLNWLSESYRVPDRDGDDERDSGLDSGGEPPL